MLHHSLYLPVQGKGWERSGRGNPSGLIRERSANPVGAACRGQGRSHRSCTRPAAIPPGGQWGQGQCWPLTWISWSLPLLKPPSCLQATADSVFILESVSFTAFFFFFIPCEINCGLALKPECWMKVKFWLVSPVKHLVRVFSLMFSCLEGRDVILFSSVTYPCFFTGVFLSGLYGTTNTSR